MTIHLRDLSPGQRFKLIRNGKKFRYLGKQTSKYSGLMIHACEREFGDYAVTSLHHSCHVKPIIKG